MHALATSSLACEISLCVFKGLGRPLLLYVIDTLTWTITLKQNLIQQVTILRMEIK